MEPIPFVVSYKGGEADRHSIDMRLLGRSMIGFEKIVSDGIILLTEQRPARRAERPPLLIAVRPPVAGSVIIPGSIQTAQWALPLAWDMFAGKAGDILWHWASFVLKFNGGRRTDAEVHAAAMQDIVGRFIESRDKSDERVHESLRRMNDQMADIARRLIPPSQNFVAPVGPACDEVAFGKGASGSTIDIPIADAIRSKGDVEVGDMEEIIVQVDGFEHHNRTLKIARLDGPGFMSAHITDPAFDQIPNLYVQAAERQARLVVRAKRTMRGERIERLHISDATRILPD